MNSRARLHAIGHESLAKKAYGVKHWINDVGWEESIELLMSKPTINVEGLVGVYTGHGEGAHAPNEYYLIEWANPKVQGIDGATRSYAEFLYGVAG